MKQDEVLNLARQADGQVTMWVNQSTIQKTTTFTFESPIDYYVSGEYPELYHIKFLERFANLVAAKEREACAKLCETIGNTQANMNAAWRNGCRDAAIEIRARGEA